MMVVRTDQYGPRIPVRNRQEFAGRIDETCLKFQPGESPEEIIRTVCEIAIKEGFRAVCLRPEHITIARPLLEASTVLISAAIAFPLHERPLVEERREPTFGDIPWEVKAEEMKQAKEQGADEFDIVMNTHYFRESSENTTDSPETYELAQLVEVADETPIKLIIETNLLMDEEIAKATRMCIAAGIEYIETGTGMLIGGQGATLHDVALIYKTILESPISRKPFIKANGGVETAVQAFELFEVGADILGSPEGYILLQDYKQENYVEINTQPKYRFSPSSPS